MAKIDREAVARLDGMDYALRRIKETGIEEFEKELQARNRSKFSLPLDNKTIQSQMEIYKAQILEFALTLSLATLHDEFGFGQKRAERYRDLFVTGAEYITKGYAYLDEYKQGIKEELNIEVRMV